MTADAGKVSALDFHQMRRSNDIFAKLIKREGKTRRWGDFLRFSGDIQRKYTIFGCGFYVFPGLDIL